MWLNCVRDKMRTEARIRKKDKKRKNKEETNETFLFLLVEWTEET